MIRHLLLSSAAALCFSTSSLAIGANYTLDLAHSRVGFTVQHLVVSEVEGQFKNFKGTGSGTFTKDEATIDSINVEIDVASIDTNELKRDKHLKSPEIFNVEKYKTMTFVSTKVDYLAKKPVKIHGNFTLHGVTKPLTLNVVSWGGVIVDPWKNEKLVFKASGVISRKEFGITWNKALETGGFLVGDDVKIAITVEANRVPDAPAKAVEPVNKSVKEPAKKK